MSKSKNRKVSNFLATPLKSMGGKKQMLVLTTIFTIVLMTGGALAQWAGIFSSVQKKQVKAGELSPASFSPTMPSKEYVYAGGKLIATEEPQGSGSSCTYSLSPSS